MFSIAAQIMSAGRIRILFGKEIEALGPTAVERGTPLARDIGQTLGDRGGASEAGALDAGAKSLLGEIGPFGAIEDEIGVRIGDQGAGLALDGGEPPGAGVDTGTGGTPYGNRFGKRSSRFEGRHCLIQIVNDDGGAGCCRLLLHPSLPNAAAVSAMRLEKPHSLSYQESTRTKRSLITWVCFRSKVELAELWLKSLETSG